MRILTVLAVVTAMSMPAAADPASDAMDAAFRDALKRLERGEVPTGQPSETRPAAPEEPAAPSEAETKAAPEAAPDEESAPSTQRAGENGDGRARTSSDQPAADFAGTAGRITGRSLSTTPAPAAAPAPGNKPGALPQPDHFTIVSSSPKGFETVGMRAPAPADVAPAARRSFEPPPRAPKRSASADQRPPAHP